MNWEQTELADILNFLIFYLMQTATTLKYLYYFFKQTNKPEKHWRELKI